MAIMIVSSVWTAWWEAGLRPKKQAGIGLVRRRHEGDAIQRKSRTSGARTPSPRLEGAQLSECEHRVTCADIGTHAHGPCESIRMFRKPEYVTDDN